MQVNIWKSYREKAIALLLIETNMKYYFEKISFSLKKYLKYFCLIACKKANLFVAIVRFKT